MTFKNPVYFSANDKDFEIDTMATFSNNGVMNFESNSVFQLLINVNDGILNFNADMGGDTFYTAVSGNILNSATINVNGQIKFSAAKADETSEYGITRIVNVSGGTFNVNGKTKIEQVVYNTGDFCIYNDTEFKEVFHNYSSGSFMIRLPTIFTYLLNKQEGAMWDKELFGIFKAEFLSFQHSTDKWDSLLEILLTETIKDKTKAKS